MIRRIVLYLAFLIPGISFSQQCDCLRDFSFIVDKIENEHPGFKLNVTTNSRPEYADWKLKIVEEIKQGVDDQQCVKLLSKYLSFIKDKHLKVYNAAKVDEKAYEKKILTQKLPEFSVLADGINYVKVPSFNYRLWKQLDNFYDSITPLVSHGQHLIVDITNNGGGGERMYNQLLKIIKKEVKGEVVVLFNRYCASACEEVALKVSGMKNVTTMGSNTNGQFAYGFIKAYKTPGCQFTFITTTKKYPKRLKYEYIGVAPQIELSKDQDWVDQALQELKKKRQY